MTPIQEQTVSKELIEQTEQVIRSHIRRTPVMETCGADFGLCPTTHLTFKLELYQHSGSFKARGAFANLLMRGIPTAGVVAASGGNHGAAVAFAAMKLGIPAKIFVPKTASPAKLKRIRDYGADLVTVGKSIADAFAASEEWISHSEALAVHPFDQTETMLGQGTLGMEFEEQVSDLDTILVSVGGGGLAGGIAAWFENRVKVIGVEPESAPTLYRAFEAGKPVEAEAGGIAVDSLAPRSVGNLVYPLAKRFINKVILVTDNSIREAQEMLWKKLRVVAEPGGATAFAAISSGRYQPEAGERVGIIVSGGNTVAVDFNLH